MRNTGKTEIIYPLIKYCIDNGIFNDSLENYIKRLEQLEKIEIISKEIPIF